MAAPRPLLAGVRRSGLTYRGALLTRMLEEAEPLQDVLQRQGGGSISWERVGSVIRRFHDGGVHHADLNARNILLGGQTDVALLDFDRARVARRAVDGRANLARLHRSLERHWPRSEPETLQVAWQRLLEGYADAG